MSIPQSQIDLIKERSDIVAVISEYVQLKRAGRNFLGLCPFHGEKTPSFNVSPEKQLFKCFGCGKGGTVYDFVGEYKKLNFPETVKFLASKCGVVVQDSYQSDRNNGDEIKYLRAISNLAAKAYNSILLGNLGEEGREYFLKRKILPQTIQDFNLGYAGHNNKQIFDQILKVSESIEGSNDKKLYEALQKIGLIRNNDKGEHYDLFRDRVVFPMTRSDGLSVGFAGRIIPPKNGTPQREGIPKYINSPESPLFSKRKTFFGLFQAIEELRRAREVYIVEGHVDVLSMYQAGFKNTLATCGTAITEDHVQILKRFIDRAIFIFDGDSAGENALTKAFNEFKNSGIDLKVISLPSGEDPDSFVSNNDREYVNKFFTNSIRDANTVAITSIIKKITGGDTSPAVVGKASKELAGIISKFNNPVEREIIGKIAADQLGISHQSFSQLYAGTQVTTNMAASAGYSGNNQNKQQFVKQNFRQQNSSRFNNNSNRLITGSVQVPYVQINPRQKIESELITFLVSNPELIQRSVTELSARNLINQFSPAVNNLFSHISKVDVEISEASEFDIVEESQNNNFYSDDWWQETLIKFEISNENEIIKNASKIRIINSKDVTSNSQEDTLLNLIDSLQRVVFKDSIDHTLPMNDIESLQQKLEQKRSLERITSKDL